MAKYGQPVISRETRLLLITIVVSVAALWVLARIRFQDRPVSSAPVPPVLAQLRPQSSYDDLARSIADIRPTVAASVTATLSGRPALRIREQTAVTLTPGPADARLASDRATGLAVVQSPSADLPTIATWVPRVMNYPRYLVAAELAGRNVALRPVFIGGLYPVATPMWDGEIWTLPPGTDLEPGTFVFTPDGAFAGLAIEERGRAAIVPAALVLSAAERLLAQGSRQAGEIGVTVQPISASIALATGVDTGVVVTAVDPEGPAAGQLVPTDVIEAADGQTILTLEHWLARVARLNAGDALSLRVRGSRGVRDVQIAAVAPAQELEEPAEATLGLQLRAVPRTGAEVLSVRPRSRAARAGIEAGDVITVIGQQTAPTPAQVTRAFGAVPQDGSLLVALTRGSEHRVVVLDKR